MANKVKTPLAQQKKVTLGGTTYTLQMVPAMWYLDIMDTCKDKNGNLKQGLYIRELLANVVASPRVEADDFTGKIYELTGLVKEIERFIMGKESDAVVKELKNETSPEEDGSETNGSSGD